MIFNYEGNPNKPVAILIHPMFTNSECYQEIVPLLKEKYYVMLPVLDGHYKGSIFVSVDNETRQIEREIERKKLGRIKMLLGISLGATIALDYFAKNSNRVAQVYLDGAPIFYWKHLSKIGNKIFYRIVREMQKDPQRGEEKMNHYFSGMGKNMVAVCKDITKETCEGLGSACYAYRKLEIPSSQQKKMHFLFGTKESARLCERGLKRKYGNAMFTHMKGYGHCGYILRQPKKYAHMLMTF